MLTEITNRESRVTGWIKRHRILSVLLLAPLTLGALNYSGMCIPEGRWLSDEERINIEIEGIVGRKQEYIMNGPEGGRMYDVVPYASVKEFKEKNPECCSIYNVSMFSIRRAIPMLSGNHSGKVITVNYTQYVILGERIIPIQSGPTEYNMRLQTNCGKQFIYE